MARSDYATRLLAVFTLALLGCTSSSGGQTIGDATPDGSANVCSPEVGVQRTDFGSDSLPAGACSSAGASCNLVTRPCSCPFDPGPRYFWTCNCNGGSWTCTKTDQDASICPTCSGDSGGEGG